MKPGERQQVVADAQEKLRRLFLNDDADLFADFEGRADHVVAEHARPSGCRTRQSRENAQRRRLPGPVGAE